DGIGCEYELRDDIDIRVRLFCISVLTSQRVSKDGFAHVAVAFRVTGNTNNPNSIFLEKAGFENLQAAMKLAGRACIVACDDENLRNTSISGKRGEKVIECRKRFDTAGDDVRHGLHAFLAKTA